jgi:hypothetical protein
MMNLFRVMISGAVVATMAMVVGVTPAEAVPVTVSQELTFTEVKPHNTFTEGTMTAANWSLNPFPFGRGLRRRRGSGRRWDRCRNQCEE